VSSRSGEASANCYTPLYFTLSSCLVTVAWVLCGYRVSTNVTRPQISRLTTRISFAAAFRFRFLGLRSCQSGSTLTAVGLSQFLARWSGTLSRIFLSEKERREQHRVTVSDVYSKCTCSRDVSASSALGVLNDNALALCTV